MKGSIFLSGGGDITESFGFDSYFFSFLPPNCKILYIPIALDMQKITPESCYDWFSRMISTHNEEREIDFTMILEGDTISDLAKYDVVYIGGGNTFKLLDYVVRNDLFEKLPVFIKNGGIFYGGSAGAIILGKDIRTVSEENDADYKYWQGLNLVQGHSLLCHYTPELEKKAIEGSFITDGSVIALPEGAGIRIVENELIPFGDVFVVNQSNISKLISK